MVEARIVSNPQRLMGKPVIAGTRISVQLILEKLGAGENIEGILEAYPHITRDSVLAALRYAAEHFGIQQSKSAAVV
jgi:uncharacterized protein (DUF433 family)